MVKIVRVCFGLILLNQICQHKILAKICGDRSTNESYCCPGYKLDEILKNCTACDIGYYGLNCEDECPPPYYGHNCKSKCNCTEISCHHVYGCELYQQDIRNDSTSKFSEWKPSIAFSTQEKQKIKALNIEFMNISKEE
uniref:Multiple epidermal growth factor-like domains 6 n=1 Tax=Magallana gigas TaxID=29159 RepID=A0A8W8M8G2_MAGGI